MITISDADGTDLSVAGAVPQGVGDLVEKRAGVVLVELGNRDEY